MFYCYRRKIYIILVEECFLANLIRKSVCDESHVASQIAKFSALI